MFIRKTFNAKRRGTIGIQGLLILTLSVSLLVLMVSAQDQKVQVNYSYGLPIILHYTGQLTDEEGVPLSGLHQVRFRIYDAPAEGKLLWESAPVQVNTDGDGTFTIPLGSKENPLPEGVFQAVAYLELEVDGEVLPSRQSLVTYSLARTPAENILGQLKPENLPNNIPAANVVGTLVNAQIPAANIIGKLCPDMSLLSVILSELSTDTAFLNALIETLWADQQFRELIFTHMLADIRFRQLILTEVWQTLITDVTFRRDFLQLLIADVKFRQAVFTTVMNSFEFQQKLISVLAVQFNFPPGMGEVASIDIELRQTILQELLVDTELVQIIITKLDVDIDFLQLLMTEFRAELLADVEFRQRLATFLAARAEMLQIVRTVLTQSVEFQQILANILFSHAEVQQFIFNLLMAHCGSGMAASLAVTTLRHDTAFLQLLVTFLKVETRLQQEVAALLRLQLVALTAVRTQLITTLAASVEFREILVTYLRVAVRFQQLIATYLSQTVEFMQRVENVLKVSVKFREKIQEREQTFQTIAGPPGLSCWDLNGNGLKDPAEDVNGDGVVNVLDCKGPKGDKGEKGDPGRDGRDGLHCWDLNGNGLRDPYEDTNGDGVIDVLDCKGPKGDKGDKGDRGPEGPQGKPGRDGLNCWDLNGNGLKDPYEDTNGDGVVDVLDCKGPKGDPGSVDFTQADKRYVLKPRDETDLTIGSLMSLGQLGGDWLAIGEPAIGSNFWSIINPDGGPNLAIGPSSPPDLSRISPSVLELTREGDASFGRNLTVARALEVGADADILGSLTVATDANVLGYLIVSGDLTVHGIKFFVQEHPNDPSKVIAYASLEGPEVGTYIRGTAQLINGEVTIELPESFSLVTSDQGLTVQVTPLEECNGLYVAYKSPEKVVVKELMGGKSNAKFDYLVQGIRKGYEDFQPIREKEEMQVQGPTEAKTEAEGASPTDANKE